MFLRRVLPWALSAVSLVTGIAVVRGIAHESGGPGSTNGIHGTPYQTVINAGAITSWVSNDGFQGPVVSHSWNGEFHRWNGTYPKGTIGGIFAEGLLWAGFVRNVTDGGPALRAGGNTYQPGLSPGAILTDGSGNVIGAQDPNGPSVRVFRVRPDWQTADLRDDAVQYYQTLDVSASMISALRDQYQKDWNEWPAEGGAPFDDRNGDGRYDPSRDVPGIPGADQTVWFVANDLNPAVAGIYGSLPVGLEMQTTLWAAARTSELRNVIFKRVRLIYKGTTQSPPGARIDSMYIAQWADPNIGESYDDFAGCDKTLGLGYGYQATWQDVMYAKEFGLEPPAVGEVLLEGPVVRGSAADRATVNFHTRAGYRNLPMTAFTYFAKGVPPHYTTEVDSARAMPPIGGSQSARQWYNAMRGYQVLPGYPDQTPLVDQFGNPTKFELSGDPASYQGDLDGRIFGWGERMILLSSGPFSMARGDTQEVILGLVGGLGGSNVGSVTVLKQNARGAQSYAALNYRSIPRILSAAPAYPTPQSASVRIVADARGMGVDAITADLFSYNGVLYQKGTLYDDGAHGDGAAGDGIFGGTITGPRQASGLLLSLECSYHDGLYMTWNGVSENIEVAGEVSVSAFAVASDNLNEDRQVNPGENIRYVVTVLNGSPYAFANVTISAGESGYPLNQSVALGTLNSNTTFTMTYNAYDPSTYFSFSVPPGFPDSVFSEVISITNPDHNQWFDTLRFPVIQFKNPPQGLPLAHERGPSEWGLSVMEVDPQRVLPGHTYVVTIADSIDPSWTRGLRLRDSTAHKTLLWNSALPDAYGHLMPVTDGVKILQGPNFGVVGIRRDSTRLISSAPPWFRGFRYTIDPQSAFNGGVTTGSQLPLYFYHVETNFDPRASMPVEVRFDAARPQKAYRLRRTGPNVGYMIQPTNPFTDVPFSAWDVTDPAHARQLTIAFRDQNNNGRWDPPVDDDGFEMIFVYAKSYDPSGTTQFHMPPSVIEDETTVGARADIVYQLSLAVLSGHALSESPQTLFVRPWYTLSSQDVFSFTTPGDVTIVPPPKSKPTQYALAQNYPNPFNPQTTIRFALPRPDHVRLAVYNLIGQQVAVLRDENMDSGDYIVRWNGTNESSTPLPSGVYFYRLDADGGFRSVKKMLLVR